MRQGTRYYCSFLLTWSFLLLLLWLWFLWSISWIRIPRNVRCGSSEETLIEYGEGVGGAEEKGVGGGGGEAVEEVLLT